MDRRKLKNTDSLHKNLISSQTSSKSGSSSDIRSFNEEVLQEKSNTLLNEETIIRRGPLSNTQVLARKRKSSQLNFSSFDSTDDLGLPLAESTILKKRKEETRKSTQQERKSQSNAIDRSISLRANIESPGRPSCKKDNFIQFLHEAGITFKKDGPHMLDKDYVMVLREMNKLLSSKKFKKAEIIGLLEKYIEDEKNLENALNDLEISVNAKVSNVFRNSSLVKALLQVSELHPEIYTTFITKINESVLMADSIEVVPHALKLLQQFRFLDVVTNSDVLISNLEILLESAPAWFQSELILFLPDIVINKQHQNIAEMLNKLLEDNCELTNLILNCMGNLNLGKEYLDEYREKMLNLLKTTLKIKTIPAIIKFIFEDCTNIEIYKKTLSVLRTVDLQPLTGEKLEDCYENQLNIINILKMNILLSKEKMNATLTVIKDVNKDPKPLDIILLLLMFSTTDVKKRNVETIFRQHIKSGFYRTSLMTLFYNDYKKVAQELQSSALQLSTTFLKTDERVFVNFAIDWLRLQFVCHKEDVFKQREILKKIILLMGNEDKTVKNALAFLCKMVDKEEERECLETHCHHLRILLEKMDNLDLEEVGTLNDLLHNLSSNSSSEWGLLRDDLFIILQKQLSHFKPLIKCKGVLAAVMAIKHLMIKAETSEAAYNLFKTVVSKVKNCPRSQALFYDQLSRVIMETQDIHNKFLMDLTNYIEEEFVNTFMADEESYKGDLIPRFGLNNEAEEPQKCVLSFENKKYSAIVPITFKLLRTCCIRLSENGVLDAIDSLLGCAILMPENFDIAEHSVVDLVICCINWFREVISAFVTQNDPLLQKQVIQRLDDLIHLQTELSPLLSLCDSKYQPQPCYFNHFSVPPFVRIEKKIVKKGKKGKTKSYEFDNFNETEGWKLGSAICAKNSAYFRKLDASIAHLLDLKMDLRPSQSIYKISLQQACFVVQELLSIFENEPSETFVRDLVRLLPKICSKLRDIVEILREKKQTESTEAARLLLCLLTKIFCWKGFESVTFNALLREGLRILAGQTNETNGMLRSCKELVAESYKYFESLSDIATQISLAIALINMCQSLMKHSESYTKENKEVHAKIAFSFLGLEWPEDRHMSPQYKIAVIGLLNNWIDNEQFPLKTVTTVLEWLPDEASKLVKPQDSLHRLPSIRRNNFHCLYKKIFDGLTKGAKVELSLATSDPQRIEMWNQVATNVQKLVKISKTLTMKNNVLIFLKYMPILLKVFLTTGMPILEHNLKYQTEDVTKIVKTMQGGTRYLHAICCDSAEKKDTTLMRYVPEAKSVLEKIIYSVKGMLVLNNSPAAFWMGNLVNKNLEGLEILSQNSSPEQSSLPSSDALLEDATNSQSDILDNDTNEEAAEEYDDE